MWLVFLLVLFGCVGEVSALERKWHTKVWTVDQGLPQNSIIYLLQAKSGFLFLGTEAGLVRFDGHNFRVYNSGNTPQMNNNRIRGLMESSDSSIWFTDLNGKLLRLKNNRIATIYELKDKLFQGTNNILEDEMGNILIIYFDGKVFRFDKKEQYSKAHFIGSFPQFVYVGSFKVGKDPVGAGSITGSFDGIYRFSKGRFFRDDVLSASIIMRGNFPFFEFDRHRSFWSHKKELFLEMRHGKFIYHRLPKKAGNYERFMIDSKDNIWLYGTFGMAVKTPQNDSLQTFEEFGKNPVNSIKEDTEGNIWVGTFSNGLIRIVENPFQLLPVGNALSKSMKAVLYDTKRNIYWLLASCSDVYQYRNGNITNAPSGYKCYLSLLQDKNGDILAGSGENYLIRIRGKERKKIYSPNNEREFFALHNHPRFGILAGHQKGILRLLPNDYLVESPWKQMQLEPTVNGFHTDRSGRTWYTSDASVGILNDNGTVTRLNNKKKPYWVNHRGIFEGKDGTIYFGTDGGGFGIFRNGQIYYISSKQGLPNDVISYIHEDDKGNLFLSSNIGLIKIQKSNIEDILKQKKEQVEFALYNTNDGLENSEFNGGFQPSGHPVGSDKLLLPTVAGPVVVNLALLEKKLPKPTVFLEDIVQDEVVIANPLTFKTLYSGQRIEFRYTSPAFSQANNLRFRYRLIGYDNAWQNAGSSRSGVYTKVPPGNYTFEVQVAYLGLFEAGNGLSFPIEITPPFYMAWWFRLLAALLFLFSLFYLAESRRKSALKKSSQRGALMKVVPDLMIRLDGSGKYLEYLAGNQNELVVPFEEMKGKYPEDIVPELAPVMREQMMLANNTGKVQKHIYMLSLKNGQKGIYEWRLVAVRSGEEYLLIIRNITKQAGTRRKLKKNEAFLKEALLEKTMLLQQLTETENARLTAFIDAQETERNRIAQDLHDSVGQLISTAKIQVGNLDAGNILPEKKPAIYNINKILDTVTHELRSISFNLLPASFTQFGLQAAITDLIDVCKQSTKTQITFYTNADFSQLSSKVQLYLYRIIQEALNNILKHAKASEVEIQIIDHDIYIMLEISDNGIGFNTDEQFRKAASSGLKNMVARTQVLNGKINIESGQSGTSFFIEIPKSNS